MKISKILAIATLAVAAGQSFNAFAASGTACTGGTATSVTPFAAVGESNTDTSSFVKVGFTIQCSNNVVMDYNDVSATMFGVVAGSVKGNQVVGGNSNGGAIRQIKACATTGCTATDVSGEIESAEVTGSSSS